MNAYAIIVAGLVFYFVWRKSTIRWERVVAYVGYILAILYGLIAVLELAFFGAVVAP